MKRTLGFSIMFMAIVSVFAGAIPVLAAADDVAHISDSTVKVLVERELARRGLAKDELKVTVDDRVVTLSGFVSTLNAKKRAAETALKAPGVARVENDLAVRMVSDTDIIPAVRKSILTHPYYDVFDWVEARVGDGAVTLSGSVREPWRRKEFEERVMNIAGVSKVENQIKVLPLSTYDDEIRIRAARIVYGSSTLNRYALGANPPIHFIVENGRVTLKGMVLNKMDRQIAETLVRNYVLAFDIKNELQLENAY